MVLAYLYGQNVAASASIMIAEQNIIEAFAESENIFLKNALG